MRLILSILLAISCLVALSQCQAPGDRILKAKNRWEAYKSTFGKSYKTKKEEAEKQTLVLQKLADIEAHNVKFQQKLVSFERQPTRNLDLTTADFLKYRTGLKMPETEKPYFAEILKKMQTLRSASKPRTVNSLKASGLGACSSTPTDLTTIDWVAAGKVSPVKDQGYCGDCWAFAAIASIESELAKKFNKFYDLSEEQINDCDTSVYNNACNGGWTYNTLRYYAPANFIANESSYPYNQGTGPNFQACQRYKLRWPKIITNDPYLGASPFGSERLNCSEANLKALVNRGPVAVAIQSNCAGFGQSTNGVFSAAPGTCRNTVDHAVLVVGYGFDTTVCKNYWLVKNSWGTDYHVGGYLKVARAFDINDATDPDYNTINIACYGMAAGYPFDFSKPGVYT